MQTVFPFSPRPLVQKIQFMLLFFNGWCDKAPSESSTHHPQSWIFVGSTFWLFKDLPTSSGFVSWPPTFQARHSHGSHPSPPGRESLSCFPICLALILDTKIWRDWIGSTGLLLRCSSNQRFLNSFKEISISYLTPTKKKDWQRCFFFFFSKAFYWCLVGTQTHM